MSHISETIEKLNVELPPEVKLVAVSKFHPLESIIEAYFAGQRVFAESRPQELALKVKLLEKVTSSVQDVSSEKMVPSVYDGSSEKMISSLRSLSVEKMTPFLQGSSAEGSIFKDIEWHFIGHLQTNKLKMVLPYVSMVQSVDSVRLLDAIDGWAAANGRVMDVLLECHVAQEEAKQGFTEEEILSILDKAADFQGIRFRGLMGMATFTDDETVIREDFSRIKHLFDEVSCRVLRGDASDVLRHFDQLSIGMTGDYKIAVEYGSTMVRIGTMIFGERS